MISVDIERLVTYRFFSVRGGQFEFRKMMGKLREKKQKGVMRVAVQSFGRCQASVFVELGGYHMGGGIVFEEREGACV